ncbi:MAG TPA: hypothetical protein VLZ31_06065 [Microbacteriaceae bacterium]|nr:hypothetical protein [Microbacteriaceae bacterium]
MGRGGTRGVGRPDRGGVEREFTDAERLEHSLRPVRERHFDPELPDDVEASELHPGARNELKTLDKELAEIVAKHLAMVARLIDDDPKLANEHAISAMRKAGRIPVTRETYAITSYVLEDYATALRELRTYRRLSGSQLQLALMIDCERALGRPEKAIETGREVDVSKLPVDQQVQVAIALSGARLDLGQPLQALYELEIEQLQPNQAYSWSPELFAAYATVLEDLGRFDEAKKWQERAVLAEDALVEHASDGSVEVFEILEDDAQENSSAVSTVVTQDKPEAAEGEKS